MKMPNEEEEEDFRREFISWKKGIMIRERKKNENKWTCGIQIQSFKHEIIINIMGYETLYFHF